MPTNPKVIKAYDAMKDLGISEEEVKPVLRNLLQVFDKNWELIEDDNYRALIDAYFESKEDKQEEHKRKAPVNCHDGERPKQKLHLADRDNRVSSADNSREVLLVENTDKPPKILKQESIKLSQTSSSLKLPSQRRLSDDERISGLPSMAARGRKSYPGAATWVGHYNDPIDEPSRPCIQRKNMSSDHHQKKIITSGTEKPKFRVGTGSTSYNGSTGASNGNLSIKSPSEVNHDMHKIEDSTCDNNTRISKSNIDIASSPLGEVKISLNCDAALRQPNFHIPNLGGVMKSVEEKYLRTSKTVEPQLSIPKLLDDLCGNFLNMGLSFNRKGSRQALTEEKKKSVRYVDDITKGSENVKVSLLDETESEDFPKFNYIPCNIMYQSANVNISLARIADEGCCADCSGDCLSLSLPCACSQETGGEFAYSSNGLLKEKFLTDCMSMLSEPQAHHYVYCKICPIERSKNERKPEPCKGHLVRKFIKECWRKCGCDMQCRNRVVQRGLSRKLQVFLTEQGKGWGVRTLEDLPKGSFVCEYAGEILTNTELYDRIVMSTGNERHTYPVTLDADWGSEVGLKDEEALCLDATHNGNVARFINHRCYDSNLIDIPVEVETPDRHYYHLALFTNRNVSAYEELTWDYGIDFDDHTHPIKAFKCCCGSSFCRDKKQKGTRLARTKKLKHS